MRFVSVRVYCDSSWIGEQFAILVKQEQATVRIKPRRKEVFEKFRIYTLSELKKYSFLV